jgi:hypothetical protein
MTDRSEKQRNNKLRMKMEDKTEKSIHQAMENTWAKSQSMKVKVLKPVMMIHGTKNLQEMKVHQKMLKDKLLPQQRKQENLLLQNLKIQKHQD